MTLQLGEKIRELRRSRNRTQEHLAQALDVTSQAVSRWEQNLSYPDMELIPAIANYFGVTIDSLFGYENDRERKIDGVLAAVDCMENDNLRGDVNLEECITMLREALAEFPGNERITHRLAGILTTTGWRRHHEWLHYNDEGYLRSDFDRHRRNEYWNEAIPLYERLSTDASDARIRTDSLCSLMMLYRNIGETDRVLSLAENLPTLAQSREIMLAMATDGKLQAKHLGNALLALTYQLAEQGMYALVNNIRHFDAGEPMEESVRAVQGFINMLRLICGDGNLGFYHRESAYLRLYLSRLEWETGHHDDAFATLDAALEDAQAYDALSREENPHYTGMLVKEADLASSDFIERGTLAEYLPTDWPMWCNPDYSEVKREITADPRWADWESRCKA